MKRAGLFVFTAVLFLACSQVASAQPFYQGSATLGPGSTDDTYNSGSPPPAVVYQKIDKTWATLDPDAYLENRVRFFDTDFTPILQLFPNDPDVVETYTSHTDREQYDEFWVRFMWSGSGSGLVIFCIE